MPAWNGSTTGLTEAQAQAACTAAINAADLPTTAEVETAAETGAAAAIVAADLPDTAEVQAAAQTGAGDAITAANLPDQTEVQAAAAAAITASAGVAIPSVVQIQSGLATATSVSNVQTTVNALPSAAQVATAVGAQAACAAAITAAQLPSATQMDVLIDTAIENRVSSFTMWAQDGAQAAITASDLPSQTEMYAGLANLQADLVTDLEGSLPGLTASAVEGLDIAGGVPASTMILAVGHDASTQPLKTTVTLSGAPTTGTLVAAAGVGLRVYVQAILVSCTVAQSTFFLSSTGGSTMGTHSLLQNSCVALNIPFGYILRSGSNVAVTLNKTTGATLVVDVWYYVST